MLLSISLILIVGATMAWLCRKIRLPSLLGMLVTGIILGPYVTNLLDNSILGISIELRKIALIVILTRAGLGLDLSGLKKIGRPAVLMCFIPASFELIGMILLAPKLMGLTMLEAAIMGAVLAAVSPAVVVPRMVKLMDEGYGVEEGIPQLILAGASVDDVYVIVLFSTFVGMMQGKGASIISFINIPVSIFLGIMIGILLGLLLADFFKKMISSGWYENRDIILESLPPHLEELPDEVKNFLREIWYLTVSYDAYYRSNARVFLSTILHSFGETTNKLSDYSLNDEDFIYYQKSVGRKLRNFGFAGDREVLIDDLGRIYFIPDSGDLYYLGGKFYEGLYNLIFRTGKSYIVEDDGELFVESDQGILPGNMNIRDIP